MQINEAFPNPIYLVQHLVRSYIVQNEHPPRLEEIVDHFEVKLPSAHKNLQALQRKGFLISDRTSSSGYFVRLIERAGAQEIVMRVPVAGKINQLVEVYDFPEILGEFPAILAGVKPDEVFALVLTEEIPQANMEQNDFIIFDRGKNHSRGIFASVSSENGISFFGSPRKPLMENSFRMRDLKTTHFLPH